jgi:hypothetical protein
MSTKAIKHVMAVCTAGHSSSAVCLVVCGLASLIAIADMVSL